MTFDFKQIGFSLESTLDGSPTLRLIDRLPNSEKPAESMHHSGGAATETIYIYGEPLKQAMLLAKDKSIEPHLLKTCIVGLGLGYIEMCWAKACYEMETLGTCDSFEVVEGLKEQFLNWLSHPSKKSVYQLCLEKLGIHHREEVLKTLQHNFLNSNHFFSDLLNTEKYKKNKWNFICYDAFSKKTNDQLWDENFLTTWLEKHSEEDCVFMTYACTGSLKRALQKNGFVFVKRPGFQGKRDATIAFKGIYKDFDLNLFT